MGDTQSAQREGKKDAAAAAAAEEESGKVEDAQTQNTEDKPLKNNGQISEINGKADGSIAEVNGHCENEIAAEAVLSPDEDVSEKEKPLKEEAPLGNIAIDEKESPNEAEANEDLGETEMDSKQNDINDGFRRFFSNIGLKLTVKRGSREIVTNVPDEINKEEPNRPKDVEDTAKETKSEDAEQNADMNTAQETYDNDSTTCPTLTDATSEDVLENAEKKTTEAEEEVQPDNVEVATIPPVGEDAHEDAKPEEEPRSASPSSPEKEVVVSPIKRFFTTGIFSGLRKKKKPAENETPEKELADMEKKEVIETLEQAVQDQQQDKEKISPGVEAAAVEAEHKENELKEEIVSAASPQTTDEGKSSLMDPSNIIVTETEILNSQEKEKVQASPLKRLLSGSNLKKLSRKQRSRRSSDAKLSDSGEHVSDQLLSSTESAENQKEESPAQPSAEAAGEDDGAWASFKKLVTPKKRVKRPSLSNEETQIPGFLEEPKPSEGEQLSDRSTEEGKKRKDSPVSWEAVLCGSGRRRGRKTSDSEDETPAESPPEISNENDILASSPKQAGSPSEGDGGSTWNSLKRLVTPKRKSKEDDENKDNVQSDSEVSQDGSSFSIKKLLPGRKKRRSTEKQDQVSSDEADKDVASGDEDSETPAVVPLSEFDTVETQVQIQTQADIETHIPEEENYELKQDLLDQMAEQVLPSDSLEPEPQKVQDNDETLEKQVSTAPATNEELDDLTESISKHQQLSDIPEEGIITETMATPVSFAEEAARDDTIAEDMIEMTSEAFTAPEPPSDITPADETEMISAVSQLSSESSKTSGNTTPVPAEYDILETDILLHQVVETMSISSETVPVCSEELMSEKIIGSVSHQILETFVKNEPTILETPRRLDATASNTGLTVGELDATNELAATPQTESISEVNTSISTEVVSEVPTEEFNTAEIAEEEIQEVNATHPEESVKELERIDKSHNLEERISEINAAVSTGEEIGPDVDSQVDAHQAETEPSKLDSQETDSAATMGDETKDEAIEQDVPNVTEKEDQIKFNLTDQELAAVQADSEEGSVQSLEKEAISEDIPAAEETVPPTEADVEPGKEDELETEAGKIEHVQVPEASEDLQSTLDSEESSGKSPEEEVKSEDILQADEPKLTAEHLPEVTAEPESSELSVTAVKTEEVQEPEPSDVVQTSTLDSEKSSGQPPEVSAEPENKELPEDAVKTEEVQEPEPSDVVQTSTLDSEKSSGQPEVSAEPDSRELSVKTKEIQEPEASDVVQTSLDSEKSSVQPPEVSAEPENKELPEDAVRSEQVQEPEVLEAVQAPTLDSEDAPEAIIVTDEPKEETVPLTEISELADTSKTENVHEPEVLQAVQAATSDSEVDGPLSLEKEVTSEDLPAVETVTDEAKQESEVSVEPEDKLQVEATETEHVQEPEVLQAVQAATSDSGAGGPLSLEKEVTSEDIPAVETVIDEAKEETEAMVEAEEELPVEAAKSEHVQEPEVIQAVQAATSDSGAGGPLSLEKEVTSEDIPAVETVTDEAKEETEAMVEAEEELPVEAAKSEHVQEPEVLPSDVIDTVTETKTEEEALTYVHAVTESIEGGSAQEIEKQILLEDIPKPDTNNVTASDETESEVVVRLDQETESIPQDVQVEQEHCIPEVVDEVQTLTPVHVSSITAEASNVHVVERAIFSEENSAPCVDSAAVTDEPKHEVHLSTAQVSIEQEKEGELPGPEMKTAPVEHAVVAQVVVCNLKDVAAAIPDVLIEKTSEINEPLIDTVASQLVLKEEVKAASSFMTDDVAKTAEEGSEIVMMHIPSVTSEDSHRIQVQVVDVDVRSAETTVDSVLEVGATETKEVIDVCHETVKGVDNLFATPKTAEGLIHEENKVTIQEVTQHVKESLSGTEPESNLEQEVIKEQDAATKVGEVVESESNEVEDQKAMDEEPAVISDDSAAEQKVSEDLIDTPDIPGSLDVSICDHKEESEETKAECEGVTAEVKSSSADLDVKEIPEQAEVTPVAQSAIVEPSNTGVVVPQNTGIISSVGNVESPSSLSLEFKLNIQFGQAKASASSPPTTPVKQINVSPTQTQTPTQTAGNQKQIDLTKVAVQATEITEPAANLDSTESMTQPVVLDVGVQLMETVEPVEQIKSTERVTSSVQASETVQPVRPTEKREVFLSQPVLSEGGDEETKAEQPVKQTEEENDQDVWMDAEEVIHTQEETEVLLLEVEEPLEPQAASGQEEKARLEVETAPTSKSEEEESQEEMRKTEGTCEIESEGEDFAVACEHQENATASVTTMEWD